MDCISVFSGAGGLDIGAARAGARVVACIDNDGDSVETLRLNAGREAGTASAEVVHADVQEVDFRRWRRRGGGAILIGGPPCQPFSKNGYWVGNANRSAQDDPRNMLGQYVRALSELAPSGFLLENVESILHPTNRPSLDGFLAAARRLRYACSVFRANAADFGVPQRRKRVFVFGAKGRRNPIPPPEPTHSDPAKDRLGLLEPHPGVGPFIARFAGEEHAEPQEDTSGGTYHRELTHVPPGDNYIALSSLKGYGGRTFKAGSRFWNFLQKLHPERTSITIAAQTGPWVGPFHWENRRLRAPEAAAIQTFPDGHRFHGSRRSVQRQIGNAVPPLLGERMVGHLMEHVR